MSFVQQNFDEIFGGGLFEFTLVVKLTKYFSRLLLKVTFPYSGFMLHIAECIAA
jgi:hypothetical protein